MPNRIVRDGIITSEAVNALGWPEEIFYRRLHSIVDDYGRYHANLSLLRAACYPLRLNDVSDQDVGKWLAVCATKGLVRVYEVEGKRYLEVVKFAQQVRAKVSKYPHPPDNCAASASHVHSTCQASAHLDVVGVVDEGEAKLPASSAKALSAGGNGSGVAYIPLNDGSEYSVSQVLAAELSKLYPAVDVPQTLNEIRAWNLANPQRRKTKRGVVQHINSWLSKEQNRGPQRA